MHRGCQKFEGGTGAFEKFECHPNPVKMPNIEGQPHPSMQKIVKKFSCSDDKCTKDCKEDELHPESVGTWVNGTYTKDEGIRPFVSGECVYNDNSKQSAVDH